MSSPSHAVGPPGGPAVRQTVAEEVRRLLTLATPVIGSQIGMMMLNVVDALMVGRVGVDELAAASLGNVWIIGTVLAAMGLIFGIDPLVSQAHGARDADRVSLAWQQGLVVGALMSLPMIPLLLVTRPALILLGQEPHLAAMAHDYALVQIPGMLPFLLFVATRQYLHGRGLVTPAVWIVLLGNAVNAGMNSLLIFGKLGFPAMGLVGSGIATTITRWFMLLALVGWIRLFRLHEGGWTGWNRAALTLHRIGEVFRFGSPVAVQMTLEVWAFQLATLMAGRFGAEALAGHTVVLNLASLSFMVPLGISIAAATRIGNLIGAGQPARAQVSAWVAFGLGSAVMGVSAVLFILGRELLPRAYTADDAVIAVGALLLPIAAAFQLFDGIQVVGSGVLRGMGRTLPAAVFNLVGYYVLAFPAAAVLAFRTPAGVAGIWWGLCIGLAAVALMLLAWVAVRGPAHVESVVGRAPSSL